MKTIGLLGGMSWESTAGYYHLINEGIKKKLGGLHSGKIVLYSVDFDAIQKLQNQGDWEGMSKILTDAALSIQAVGADFLLICTNTMHKVAPDIENALDIPLIHIADAAGEALLRDGVKKAGLLGTAFTMEQDFYRVRLAEKFGLEVIIPGDSDRKIVHNVIYDELCKGRKTDASRDEYIRIIRDLANRGAEGVILGCTEIGMLVTQEDTDVKLYDTTVIHAASAVEHALS